MGRKATDGTAFMIRAWGSMELPAAKCEEKWGIVTIRQSEAVPGEQTQADESQPFSARYRDRALTTRP